MGLRRTRGDENSEWASSKFASGYSLNPQHYFRRGFEGMILPFTPDSSFCFDYTVLSSFTLD